MDRACNRKEDIRAWSSTTTTHLLYSLGNWDPQEASIANTSTAFTFSAQECSKAPVSTYGRRTVAAAEQSTFQALSPSSTSPSPVCTWTASELLPALWESPLLLPPSSSHSPPLTPLFYQIVLDSYFPEAQRSMERWDEIGFSNCLDFSEGLGEILAPREKHGNKFPMRERERER